MWGPASGEVFVGELKTICAHALEQFTVTLYGVIQAGQKQLLGCGGRDLERQRLERTDLGDNVEDPSQEPRSHARLFMLLTPFPLITSPREAVKKLAARDAGL